LETKISKLDAAQRHVRAITDIFLGQAHFYQKLEDPKAEEYFLEALKIFEDDGDEWNTLWTLYYLADLYMSGQAHEKAIGLCRRALQGAGQAEAARRDYEIIANIHRVLADVHWQTGQKEESFRHYAYAVGSAYLYHGIPSPADLYTRSLQREMMERALARLKSLCDEGKTNEALQFCDIVLEFFSPYRDVTGQPSADPKALEECLTQNKTEALMAHLFPRLPKDEELNQKGMEYTDHVQCLLGKLAPPTDLVIEPQDAAAVTKP
jgi:tetratricopeptide (TPR) repeat protein